MKMKKIFVSFALCIGMAKAHAVVCVPDTNVVDLNVDITGAVTTASFKLSFSLVTFTNTL